MVVLFPCRIVDPEKKTNKASGPQNMSMIRIRICKLPNRANFMAMVDAVFNFKAVCDVLGSMCMHKDVLRFALSHEGG